MRHFFHNFVISDLLEDFQSQKENSRKTTQQVCYYRMSGCFDCIIWKATRSAFEEKMYDTLWHAKILTVEKMVSSTSNSSKRKFIGIFLKAIDGFFNQSRDNGPLVWFHNEGNAWLYSFAMETELSNADSRNLPEAPAASVLPHVACNACKPICASVLQRVATTTTQTKIGQLRYKGGCHQEKHCRPPLHRAAKR